MKFNENLKYLRKKEGLTQEELAEKLNVSRQAVTKWESGQALPDITNLQEISIMFGVNIDKLLGNEKAKNGTTLEKKIKDLPLLMFYYAMIIFILILELQIENVLILIGIIIGTFPIIGILVAKYLKRRQIINLAETEEGKKEREKLIIKDAAYVTATWIIANIVIYIVRYFKELDNKGIYEIIIETITCFSIAFIIQKVSIKNKVKKYNE